MRKKIAKLEDAELDYAVAVAFGLRSPSIEKEFDTDQQRYECRYDGGGAIRKRFAPSTRGDECLEIVEREKINTQWFYPRHHTDHRYETWSAWSMHGEQEVEGPTFRIATMRCFAISKLGDELDIPNAK